jgi:Uma2 family endonuclease
VSTLTTPPTASRPSPSPPPSIVLHGVSWGRYEAFWNAFEGERAVRLNYDRGVLEIMTISGRHSWLARLLGRFVIVLTEELGLPIRSGGDATRRRRDLERALEPDESFWVTNEPRIRTRDEVDLMRDPPPDLCLEVEVSRTVVDRLAILAALRVPEVWHGDEDGLTFLRLNAQGAYEPAPRSGLFPLLTPQDLLTFVQRRHDSDENTLVRDFRAWVRQQIAQAAQPPQTQGPPP